MIFPASRRGQLREESRHAPLIDDKGVLRRLTSPRYPQARLDRAASPSSRERCHSMKIIQAPIDDHEAVECLKEHWGAGTAGKRLREVGYTWTGTGVGIFENAAEGLMNPLVWATFGLGEAMAGLKGTAAFSNGLWYAKTGMSALKWTNRLATVSLLAPWAIAASDDMGKTLDATYRGLFAEGKFDDKYFDQLTKTGTDALFWSLMYRAWRGKGTALKDRAKVLDEIAAKDAASGATTAKTPLLGRHSHKIIRSLEEDR